MKLLPAFMFVMLFVTVSESYGQKEADTAVYTRDIDNFWIAFDSVTNLSDPALKLLVLQSLYIDKGTEGLKAFMRARNYTAENYIRVIERYPFFWKSVRKNTLAIKSQVPEIEKSIGNLRTLYPEMKAAAIYFTIGGLRSGGTTFSNMVLIGTEMAAADTTTDASELNTWLRNMIRSQVPGSIVGLNLHEFIHTQQRAPASILLAQCLHEGAADFVAELVTKQKNLNDYMIYGKNNEATLKLRFRNEMMRRSVSNWLFNGDKVENHDLGYYMGYAICRAYYTKSADKRKAIREIIELDYSSRTAITAFLDQSGYYGNPNVRIQ